KGYNQYTPMPGLMMLREKIAEKTAEQYDVNICPEAEITITPGGTMAIYTAISAFIQPGDEVILFSPAYDCYAPAIKLHGGIPVFIPLNFPDYSIDWQQVQTAV